MSSAVFPDNTVFCNFAAVRRVDLLGELLRGRGRWTEAVQGEVSSSRGFLPDLQDVAGFMSEAISIDDPEDIAQVQRIRRVVFGGDALKPLRHLGEAETCHLLRTRADFHGAWWVTDDRDALRYARIQGITTMETIDLIRHGVADADLTADAGHALLVAMAQASRSLRVSASPADLT